MFTDPALANWRLNLALGAALEKLEELETRIREEGSSSRLEAQAQHAETRRILARLYEREARERAGKFTREQLEHALDRYRELALESCDIIDLANLPESDRHVATRQLELRRLYVPLRIHVEISAEWDPGEDDLKKIEKRREKIHRRGLRTNARDDARDKRTSIGERLSKTGRLVLLGDPGAGKTTLIRWLATAYLLRLKKDEAFRDLPDVDLLPDHDWLPIVIRCRDIGPSNEAGTIDAVLGETFRKANMTEEETAALQAVMRELLASGKAILLVDGLDEISNVSDRSCFCQSIERIHIAFPKAPVVVTSRIVGYREMKYRIGRGFEHATAADFTKEDKDEFARRWCELTELPERRVKAAEELIRAIHGAERIERLTGNPMLLTTMALVKRKVGKLPNRRADLYWEAVMVLLNWRSEVDEPMDHREAIPQLEYIAYEMCRKGVQRLREDEILELLERMRKEYPYRSNKPLEFNIPNNINIINHRYS